MVQHSDGYLALVGTNTYSGGTTATGGQIIYYYNSNSFGTGAITVGGSISALVNNTSPEVALTITNPFAFTGTGLTVNLASGNPVSGAPGTTWAGNFVLPASGTTTIDTSSTATEETEISGIISGSGANLTISDAGILVLAGSNTYTGVTTIAQGTAQVAIMDSQPNYGPLGVPATPASSIVLSGGTLQFSGANSFDYSSRFSSASTAYNIDVNGQSVTFASAISGGGSLTLTNSAGPGGTLYLTGANTYTGGIAFGNGGLPKNRENFRLHFFFPIGNNLAKG